MHQLDRDDDLLRRTKPEQKDASDGEILAKFGAIYVYQLRQIYGAGFAPGIPSDLTISQVLGDLDESSAALLARGLQA